MGTVSAVAVADELRLARWFGDGMVAQRDVAIPVWGWAAPGDEVAVALGGQTRTTRADASGAWNVKLPARPAGGPFELAVATSGVRRVVRDVVVGDVWLCSGQSNMEWTVADSRDAEWEIAAATDGAVRHFKVPRGWAAEPQTTLEGGAWEASAPDRVGGFTAVGYFFARELRRHVDVPVGLIHASWGGSRIEPWMSGAALGLEPEDVQRLERDHHRRLEEAIRERLGKLPREDAGLVDGRALWADPALDDGAWEEMNLPARWEEAGFDGLDGVVWFRKTFDLTAKAARHGARLSLGTIDDSDVTWVNGREVGRMTLAWNRPRIYQVPAMALVPGRNVIAVRVEDTGGGGGIYGKPDLLYLDAGGERHSLAGAWKLEIGVATLDSEGHKNQIPTLLYNAMIHPLLATPIRGVLWYQGESNAWGEDAVAYRQLFVGMIEDWRAAWGRGDIPFLFVQLANFSTGAADPADSSWALLRESQSAALALPATAQAVTIDVGEADNIHPRNKQDVGLRLALAARKLVYGQDVVHSGPVYRSHQVRGARVVVDFDHTGGGLVTRGAAGQLRSFTVAGEDRRFVDAQAAIDGDRVVVWSAAVPEPVAVRYAWSDDPSADLYNAEGLPASPFRTDRWTRRSGR